jgi:putative methionine-R-sulfoxide reductase with GAF domain
MYFEVFIPAADSKGYDVNMTVEADNWMMALKSGLARTGETDELIRNVMCDIKDDNTIHVTDATSRRVFVLRELAEPKAEEADGDKATIRIDVKDLPFTPDPTPVIAAKPVVLEPAPAPAPTPAPTAAPAVQIAAPAAVDSTIPASGPSIQVDPSFAAESSTQDSWSSPDGRMRIGSSTFESLRRDDPQAKVVEERRVPSGQRPALVVGRGNESVSQNIMEEVFLEINQIHEGDMSMEQVVNFVMDLSLEKVGAEAGSVMFADVNGRELYFATARGPKAHEVMNFRVPMGKGIAGFCAREGVSLAISDAEKDPRFYREISEALGYPTQSMCCAPIQFDGRVFGAIELLNKKNNHFIGAEVNVLTYIGRQLGKYVYDLIMAREKLE